MVVEDIGSKVEREAVGGDVKEEEGGGGKAESEENATGRRKEKLGRQKATEAGGEKNALKGKGAVEQRALKEAEQSALKGGVKSQEGAAALVLAAALCHQLLL